MQYEGEGCSIGARSPNFNQGSNMNLSKVKEAVVTTALVLAVVYALNQVSATRGVVQKALNG